MAQDRERWKALTKPSTPGGREGSTRRIKETECAQKYQGKRSTGNQRGSKVFRSSYVLIN
jgi:hypothetical protein